MSHRSLNFVGRAPQWLVALACWSISTIGSAQQFTPYSAPDSLVPAHRTGIAVDEPRTLPTATALEARPLSPAYEPLRSTPQITREPRVPQPPVNFRLVSAEEATAPEAAKPARRLAPRGQNPKTSGTKPVAASPNNALITVAGSLSIVLGLFCVVVWCSRRFTPAGTAILPKEAVELLGRMPLAGRQQMQLVRIGNKLLLVALSPVGSQTLTEISDAAEVEHLTALCRRGQPGSSSVAFRQALAQLGNEPAERGFVGPARAGSRGGR